MQKKKVKSSEEKNVEGYFPIDETSTQYATEKKSKNEKSDYIDSIEKKEKQTPTISYSSVEKTFKKPTAKDLEIVTKVMSKKTTKKKVYKKKATGKKTATKTKIEYSPPKVTLKKTGHELIITEKPQAANKIAVALDDKSRPKQLNYNKVPYYEISRKGKKIIVACAVGHLFTLTQDSTGALVPTFEISWKPNYLVRKADFTKRYYDTLLKLVKEAGSITIATDFDIEGEVIGMNVMRYIGNQKDAQRMKFSTLTPKELNEAYDKKMDTISWGQAIAGETRHYLDWYYGINLSRALMNAIKTTGRFKIMSIGRVQGPALNIIVKKEREIAEFKSTLYWQVFITIDDNKHKVELKYIKDIIDKKELNKFENLVGKKAIATTEKSQEKIAPPVPFNLTTLQTEAYKFHGINPSRTLQAAQSLYLAGLISYPRTSSQKLPDSIDYKSILKNLARAYNVTHLIKKDKPIEGKKTDPAHPSIYPTGNSQILSGDEEKIYNLIVKRFLALFCEDAIVNNKTITAKIKEKEDLIFNVKGASIEKRNWMDIYPYKLKENEIPDINGETKVIDSHIDEKETQPPKRYSPASIISQLEKKNLGTKATRSSIVETLFDRGYVKGQSIEATPLGISLINTMEKYSPIIIDEELTRDFEKEMNSIEKASKGLQEKENQVLEKAQKTISQIAKQFKENENKIGNELLNANIELQEQQKTENTLIKCPKCNKGNLFINYSKKNRRQFIACDAYPNCTNTYSLPPNGMIKKTDGICEECGYPKLMRLTKGKKPWIFCFNPFCKTNEEWVKKREENKKVE